MIQPPIPIDAVGSGAQPSNIHVVLVLSHMNIRGDALQSLS
jgi:hypothetical protein